MTSRRNPSPTIVLAANSPLYAPILLAKAEHINKTCNRMRLEVANYPSPLAETQPVDPFIGRLLSQANVYDEILIGIGDPMRMTALPIDHPGYAEPKVIGNLINKMCYWLVNHRRWEVTEDRWEEAFDKVLVHPKGMAGFTVPCYDYYVRNNNTGLDAVQEFLLDDLDPNHERYFYDRINESLEKQNKKPNKPLAFITTNPLHASKASMFAKRYGLVKAFCQKPYFCNLIMTGILVAQEIHAEKGGEEEEAITEFKDGLMTAIAYISHDPRYAAYRLYRALESGLIPMWNSENHQIEPYFASWTLDELKQSLKMMERISAYTPDLVITESQWERTKAMRLVVEPLLDSSEKARSAAALTSENCDFQSRRVR